MHQSCGSAAIQHLEWRLRLGPCRKKSQRVPQSFCPAIDARGDKTDDQCSPILLALTGSTENRVGMMVASCEELGQLATEVDRAGSYEIFGSLFTRVNASVRRTRRTRYFAAKGRRRPRKASASALPQSRCFTATSEK